MIDAHVHLRDWKQQEAESLEHGLRAAVLAGLDAVFEMPNTDPPILDRKTAEKRIVQADALKFDIFHGIYLGLTSDREQIAEAVKTYNSLFPRVVGFKLFAGRSTGDLSVPDTERQAGIFAALTQLDYRGVLAVHAEKEALFRPELWNPSDPATHCLARPPEAETESVADMLNFAAASGFKGTLHIPHVSVPDSVEQLRKARSGNTFKVSCGVTPHHLFMNAEDMRQENGMLMKCNPPLRTEEMNLRLQHLLITGDIDWVETDHAPHTPADKNGKHASGIPGIPLYPVLPELLRRIGLDDDRIDEVTHRSVERIFGIEIPRHRISGRFLTDYPTDPWPSFLSRRCGSLQK